MTYGVDVESEFIAQDTHHFYESLAKDDFLTEQWLRKTFLQISESNLTLSELELRT